MTAVALSALSLLYCFVLDLLYLIRQRSDSSSSTCVMQHIDMVDPLTMYTIQLCALVMTSKLNCQNPRH